MPYRLWLVIGTALVCAILIGFVLPLPAHARSNCKFFTDGREPLCWTQPDGRGQPYIDDRKNTGFSDDFRKRNWERVQRRQAWRRGASHTEDMASGGTMHGSILVSPFVPGSVEDRGWQAERKRRGMCGNDRLCLNQ
jgi:hypothetical protein